jgi:Flp pilus assembly pilin Flp
MPIRKVWADDSGQDIAEYALMLAIILIVALATIQAIGINAGVMLSRLASTLEAVK